jgi:hypothetical protein
MPSKSRIRYSHFTGYSIGAFIGCFAFSYLSRSLSDQTLITSQDIISNAKCFAGEAACVKPVYFILAPIIIPFVLSGDSLGAFRFIACLSASAILGCTYLICFRFLNGGLSFSNKKLGAVICVPLAMMAAALVFWKMVGFSPLESREIPAPFFHLLFQTLSIALFMLALAVRTRALPLAGYSSTIFAILSITTHASSFIYGGILLVSNIEGLLRGRAKNFYINYIYPLVCPGSDPGPIRMSSMLVLPAIVFGASFLMEIGVDLLLNAWARLFGGGEFSATQQSDGYISRLSSSGKIAASDITSLILILSLSYLFYEIQRRRQSRLSPAKSSAMDICGACLTSVCCQVIVAIPALALARDELFFRLTLYPRYVSGAVIFAAFAYWALGEVAIKENALDSAS